LVTIREEETGRRDGQQQPDQPTDDAATMVTASLVIQIFQVKKVVHHYLCVVLLFVRPFTSVRPGGV
jgi:hypothetical protein